MTTPVLISHSVFCNNVMDEKEQFKTKLVKMEHEKINFSKKMMSR